MGRAPCCDKANVKKGPWSPEEDAKLKSYIEQHGTGGNWIALPQKMGLKRCGKSCRLRWLNYLRPNIKHGGFSEEEENIICNLYISIGSRWSIIAAQLPGRTDNDIKNYWNTRLKNKLLGKQRKEQNAMRRVQKQHTMKRRNYHHNLNDNNIVLANDHTNNNHINGNNPYWPQLQMVDPRPYTSMQRSRLNDHASIRKLLIKLGGRFSCGDDQLMQKDTHSQEFPSLENTNVPSNNILCDQTPIISSCFTIDPQIPALCESGTTSSTRTRAINSPRDLVQTHEYTLSSNLQNVQGQNSDFGSGLEDIVGSNISPRLIDGLEFLLADENMVCSRSATTSNSTSFPSCDGDMSSLIYPTLIANCNGDIFQQNVPQVFGFDDLIMSYTTGSS